MGRSGGEIHGAVCRIGTGPESVFSQGELRVSTSRQSLVDRELRGSKVEEQDQDLAAEMPSGPPRLYYDVSRSSFRVSSAASPARD